MEWTCWSCEKQVDERHYDLDERMCDDCMNEDISEPIEEPDNIIKADDINWVSPNDPGDENI